MGSERLLALNLAHYQAIHGEIPLQGTLAMLGMAEPNEAQVKLLTDLEFWEFMNPGLLPLLS